MNTQWTDDLQQALLAPFAAEEVKARKGAGGSLAYIDARAARRRIAETVPPGAWEFRCALVEVTPQRVIAHGSLTILGVTREDAGEAVPNAANPELEMSKAAVSDAFKRCCAAFGIGAFLYELGAGASGARPSAAAIDAAARRAGWRGSALRIGEAARDPAPEAVREPAAPAFETPAAAAPPAPGGGLAACAGCGKALTKGQQDVSMRAYSRPLCPGCQRSQARAGAGAAN